MHHRDGIEPVDETAGRRRGRDDVAVVNLDHHLRAERPGDFLQHLKVGAGFGKKLVERHIVGRFGRGEANAFRPCLSPNASTRPAFWWPDSGT